MMKIAVTILFMGLFSFLSFGQVNQTDAQGRKQGQWIKTYPNSSVVTYQGTFKNDKPIGTFTYKYPSNKLKAIIKYDSNSTRSEANYYYENGKLMSHGIYRNMKKDSVWVSFNEDGRIAMTETFKNDELNGVKNMYYIPSDPEDRSETIISVYTYVDGLPEGKFVEYYPTKVVRKTGQYRDHKRVGEWITYELNGKKMFTEHFYNGKMHGWFIGYDKNGNEAQKRYFHFGRLVQGDELKQLLQQMKEKGINPNGE